GTTEHVPVDLNAVVTDALALLRPEFRTHQVNVEFEPGKRLPAVPGDAVQLQQVVINLAVNAIQAMGKLAATQRKLSLRAEVAGGEVVLTVADSGPGLGPGEAEEIFSPFHTTKADGMGLGLSICRSIV